MQSSVANLEIFGFRFRKQGHADMGYGGVSVWKSLNKRAKHSQHAPTGGGMGAYPH